MYEQAYFDSVPYLLYGNIITINKPQADKANATIAYIESSVESGLCILSRRGMFA